MRASPAFWRRGWSVFVLNSARGTHPQKLDNAASVPRPLQARLRIGERGGRERALELSSTTSIELWLLLPPPSSAVAAWCVARQALPRRLSGIPSPPLPPGSPRRAQLHLVRLKRFSTKPVRRRQSSVVVMKEDLPSQCKSLPRIDRLLRTLIPSGRDSRRQNSFKTSFWL